MRHTIQMIAIALMLPVIAGCALLQQEDSRLQLTVQYATLKLIERSGDITAADVMRHVERARDVVEQDTSITVSALAAQVREAIRWERLDAADRLVVDAVLTEAEAELAARIGDGVLSPDQRVAILTLFDWIERAAQMAQGDASHASNTA